MRVVRNYKDFAIEGDLSHMYALPVLLTKSTARLSWVAQYELPEHQRCYRWRDQLERLHEHQCQQHQAGMPGGCNGDCQAVGQLQLPDW